MHKHKFFVLAIGWTLLITALSLMSLKEAPKIELSFADKIAHVIIYLIFTILWFLAFSRETISKLLTKKAILISSIVSVFYGIIIELLQENFTTYRQGDLGDVLANTVGVLFAVIILLSIGKLKRKN